MLSARRIFLNIALLTAAGIILWGMGSCAKEDQKEPFVRYQKDRVIRSRIFNRELYYSVVLPANYDQTTDSFPVVYLLHGFGDNQSAWFQDGLIQYYSDQYESENGPMIFVLPQGFNSYYVNRYNGSLPYMDYFVHELVPAIDSIYRTRKDKSQRAVMGYSMGGYGAMILPVKHPEIFSTGVVLSMSFRTDEQYLAEPQDVFDNQWGLIFGGYHQSGTARLTDYFMDYSPFHFFNKADVSEYSDLRLFFDCGSDEESLHITNGELHNLMRDRSITHEFRVRTGGHSWDYWHKSLPEALKFISYGFRGTTFPGAEPVNIGTPIAENQCTLETLAGTGIQLRIFTPADYQLNTNDYPVIYFLHDYTGGNRNAEAIQILSLLANSMTSGKLPNSIIVEIPAIRGEITPHIMNNVMELVSAEYRTVADKKGKVIAGNGAGGTIANELMPDLSYAFNGCFLYNAHLGDTAQATSGIFYYIDVTDEADFYRGNYNLFKDIRNKDLNYRYRVRQGKKSLQDIINGISESLYDLSKRL